LQIYHRYGALIALPRPYQRLTDAILMLGNIDQCPWPAPGAFYVMKGNRARGRGDAEKISPYSLLPTPYSLLPTPYSLLPTPYSLLPTPYSLLPTPYSPLPAE
jgi:hypothetical protein